MQNYSGTYLGVIVGILAIVLPKLGIEIGSETLTSWLSTTVFLASSVYTLFKRWQKGDVTLLGSRK